MPRVLLVDDDSSVTDGLRRQLRREPYEIVSATSGAQALQLLRREAIDVVISDERMPGMSGSELLAAVFREFPQTVRMVLTGHASLQATLRAINEGQISRFFIKPCDPAELATAIRQAIQQKELMAESRRLLSMVRQQQQLIRTLDPEGKLSRKLELVGAGVRQSASTAIVLEDAGEDIDALTSKIKHEIETCELYLRASR